MTLVAVEDTYDRTWWKHEVGGSRKGEGDGSGV